MAERRLSICYYAAHCKDLLGNLKQQAIYTRQYKSQQSEEASQAGGHHVANTRIGRERLRQMGQALSPVAHSSHTHMWPHRNTESARLSMQTTHSPLLTRSIHARRLCGAGQLPAPVALHAHAPLLLGQAPLLRDLLGPPPAAASPTVTSLHTLIDSSVLLAANFWTT